MLTKYVPYKDPISKKQSDIAELDVAETDRMNTNNASHRDDEMRNLLTHLS